MTFVKVNGTEYAADIFGRMIDREWNDRESKTITTEMTYQQASELFVDDAIWSIVERNDGVPPVEYDNSAFCVAGDITVHRDGTITAKMGKPTDLELAYEELYG